MQLSSRLECGFIYCGKLLWSMYGTDFVGLAYFAAAARACVCVYVRFLSRRKTNRDLNESPCSARARTLRLYLILATFYTRMIKLQTRHMHTQHAQQNKARGGVFLYSARA